MALVKCVISGGQTGADQAGLFAARELDINTGGYAPKGWRTEKGPAPWLADYDLAEWPTEGYIERTRANVEVSNATVIFGKRSPGSNATEEHCRVMGKPCMWVTWPASYKSISDCIARAAKFKLWLAKHKVSILNVAGNRASKNPGIEGYVKEFLLTALK